MTGVLCVNKPQDFTSFDVVAKLRGMLKTKKIGHSGTLDPMATGVLPILVGRATKLCDILPEQDKAYRATIQLGIETDTYDITGQVTAQGDYRGIDTARVLAAYGQFVGEIDQIPPMYSAIKVGGQKLYDLARRGVEVERPARRVVIHAIELVKGVEDAGLYTLDVSCSKGTYIRSLAHDIGQLLGCHATLAALERTLSNGFSLADCLTLEEIQNCCNAGSIADRFLPVERVLTPLTSLTLDEVQQRMFLNGVRLDLKRVANAPKTTQRCTVFSKDKTLLGTAIADCALYELRMEKLLMEVLS